MDGRKKQRTAEGRLRVREFDPLNGGVKGGEEDQGRGSSVR